MKKLLVVVLIPIIVLLVFLALPSWAGKYPERTISLIVPNPPGGAGDLGARTLASFLEPILKNRVVILNKPGGSSLIGGNDVASAKPDGYTLGYLPVVPAIPETFRYFMESTYTSKDLVPICPVTNVPGAIIVRADAPWKTIKDFVEYARQTGTGMKVGTRGPGSIPQLMLLGIEKAENVKFTDVPFPGDSAIALAVLGGHIQAGVSSYGAVMSQVRAGNLRILLLYTKKRLETAPGIPCITDREYETPIFPFYGLFGPKGLPDEIVKTIDRAVKQIVENPKFGERITALGFEIIYEGPESFKKTLNTYQSKIEGFYRKLGYWKD